MVDEYVLRYFPSYVGERGFGKKEGEKGIGSVSLKTLEQVAEILEREGIYDCRLESEDSIKYTFKKGEEIVCGEVRGDDDMFILSEDVYIYVEKVKDVPYGSVEGKTGHRESGVREARPVRSLRSLSFLSLVNTAVFRLVLPVEPLEIDMVDG